MNLKKKLILVELGVLVAMLGMSNTVEYCLTKGMLNQGYKKKAIEEQFNNTRYDKPIVGKLGYEINKPGRELAYYIHSKL